MSHWQEWVVALVLLVCIVRIGKRLYATFRASKEGRTACGCCPGSCHCHCGKTDKTEEKDTESCCERLETKARSMQTDKCGVSETKARSMQADSCPTDTAAKKHKCCCG